MPTIVMQNGTENVVDDDYARSVWVLKYQFAQPKNDKQKKFIQQVREVRFDNGETEPPKSTSGRRSAENWPNRQARDQQTRAIVQDKRLSGREKARRISELIKQRQGGARRPGEPVAHEVTSAWMLDSIDQNGTRRWVGVKYCIHCRVGWAVTEPTIKPDTKPRLKSSDITIVEGEADQFCSAGR